MGNEYRASSYTTISEMREFSSFSAREQRFIKLSLEIARGKGGYEGIFLRWSRDLAESKAIISRQEAYADLPKLRTLVPQTFSEEHTATFLGPLIDLSNFDLQQEGIGCFSAYRFLYERLLGALVRPWLPSAFCAAAALPNVKPERRKLLLQSISEAAATASGWSIREPTFLPEFVEKVDNQ